MSKKPKLSETPAAKVLIRAWADKTFKAGLLKDANAALATMGIKVPAGTTIRVIEDTPSVRHYVLPVQPTGELRDEHLETAVGGSLSPSLTTHREPGKGG